MDVTANIQQYAANTRQQDVMDFDASDSPPFAARLDQAVKELGERVASQQRALDQVDSEMLLRSPRTMLTCSSFARLRVSRCPGRLPRIHVLGYSNSAG